MNHLRRDHASYLNQKLNFDEIDLPYEDKKCKHVYQMYTLKLKQGDRTQFVQELRSQGIGASVHFDPPVHLQTFYRKQYGYKEGDLPITERVSKEIITLPMYPGLTKRNLDYMIKTIGSVLLKLKKE